MLASPPISAVFGALSHPTRLRVVEQLGRGPASVSDLAAKSDMALPSFCQHLRVLEEAGLVRSRKRGRVRTYTLAPQRLAEAESWLQAQRSMWEQRLDQLDSYLLTLKEQNP